MLDSPGVAPLTPETGQQPQSLWQPRDAPALAPPTARQHEDAPLSYGRLEKGLWASRTRSGAAVGGDRLEHWRAVLSEPWALRAFCGLYDRLAEGRVPENAAATRATSEPNPPRKGERGVKPIAALNILQRSVGRALATARRSQLADALGRQNRVRTLGAHDTRSDGRFVTPCGHCSES